MPEYATHKTCTNCGANTIQTHHDYIHGIEYNPPYVADPTRITPQTTASCIIIGRKTYNETETRHGHHYLTQMNPTTLNIRNQHHTKPTWHTLPAHRCHQPLPGTPITNPPQPKPTPNNTDPNQLNLTPPNNTPWGAHNPNNPPPKNRPF